MEIKPKKKPFLLNLSILSRAVIGYDYENSWGISTEPGLSKVSDTSSFLDWFAAVSPTTNKDRIYSDRHT